MTEQIVRLVKLEGKQYWSDKNDNRWSVDKYDEATAAKLSKRMHNCVCCTNSEGLRFCYLCQDCKDCSFCYNCTGCTNCNFCDSCNGCNLCDGCDSCDNSNFNSQCVNLECGEGENCEAVWIGSIPRYMIFFDINDCDEIIELFECDEDEARKDKIHRDPGILSGDYWDIPYYNNDHYSHKINRHYYTDNEPIAKAYTPDGNSVYLRVDVAGNVIVEFDYIGEKNEVSIEEFDKYYSLEGGMYCVFEADPDNEDHNKETFDNDNFDDWIANIEFIGSKEGCERYIKPYPHLGYFIREVDIEHYDDISYYHKR